MKTEIKPFGSRTKVSERGKVHDSGEYNTRVFGDSYVVFYPEEWKKEYEENGTKEFIVEANGGIRRTYQIMITDFGNWSATYRDMSVNYSKWREVGLGE